jgi:uncharacterized protein (UPF0548 family)
LPARSSDHSRFVWEEAAGNAISVNLTGRSRFLQLFASMFTLHRPTEEQIRAYLARQDGQPFSYEAAGCTREELPAMPGWNVDRQRVHLGRGREVFERAKRAICQWEMFPQALARICNPDQAPQQDLVVGVLYKVRLVPLWILFPARVVWIVDEPRRFGFAYGTLPGHPECGEERFVAQWNESDDSVWYDLLAVSRPAHWLARIGYPYTRWEQARFRRLSGEAMQRALG